MLSQISAQFANDNRCPLRTSLTQRTAVAVVDFIAMRPALRNWAPAPERSAGVATSRRAAQRQVAPDRPCERDRHGAGGAKSSDSRIAVQKKQLYIGPLTMSVRGDDE
jgi:hypothetical protein